MAEANVELPGGSEAHLDEALKDAGVQVSKAASDNTDLMYRDFIKNLGAQLGNLTTDQGIQASVTALNKAWQAFLGAVKALEAKAPAAGATQAQPGALPGI